MHENSNLWWNGLSDNGKFKWVNCCLGSIVIPEASLKNRSGLSSRRFATTL